MHMHPLVVLDPTYSQPGTHEVMADGLSDPPHTTSGLHKPLIPMREVMILHHSSRE